MSDLGLYIHICHTHIQKEKKTRFPFFKSNVPGAREMASIVNSVCYSCRGPQPFPQHQRGVSQLSAALVLEDLTLFSDLLGHQAHMWSTYIFKSNIPGLAR